MKLHHQKTDGSIPRSESGTRGRPMAKFRALTIALATMAACLTIMAPTPASAATNTWEIASGNGLRVDVMWASTSPYQGAFLWTDNSSASQEFDLLDSGSGFYRISARHSGQCLMLDWRGGPYVNGTKIIQYPYCAQGYGPAEWYTESVWRPNGCTSQCFTTGTWYAHIKNRTTGKCLEAANAAGGFPGQTAVLQQWDCSSVDQWNAWNQLWTFTIATSQLPPLH